MYYDRLTQRVRSSINKVGGRRQVLCSPPPLASSRPAAPHRVRARGIGHVAGTPGE